MRLISDLFRIIFIVFMLLWVTEEVKPMIINFNHGENQYTVHTKQKYLNDVLKENNIILNAKDMMDMPINSIVTDGMTINIDLMEYTIEYDEESENYKSYTKLDYNLPLWTETVVQVGMSSSTQHYYDVTYKNDDIVDREYKYSVTTTQKQDEIIAIGKGNPKLFYGTLTGYGPDCVGCIGKVYCKPWPNVQETITFLDNTYGEVRIVAADRNIPCGTVVEITGYKNPVVAIVLDRGSAIVGKTMDLLFHSEEETVPIGRRYNIKYEILRWGW